MVSFRARADGAVTDALETTAVSQAVETPEGYLTLISCRRGSLWLLKTAVDLGQEGSSDVQEPAFRDMDFRVPSFARSLPSLSPT
jgi:hypothetical protein